jgi:hypothetical protein
LEARIQRGGDPPAFRAGYNWDHTASRVRAVGFTGSPFFISFKELCSLNEGDCAAQNGLGFKAHRALNVSPPCSASGIIQPETSSGRKMIRFLCLCGGELREAGDSLCFFVLFFGEK